MKYTENYKKRRLGTGFYIGLALCLLIIGGASWFALAPLSEKNTTSKDNTSSQNEEYQNPSQPYTENTPEITPEPVPEITPEIPPDTGILNPTVSETPVSPQSEVSENVTAKEEKIPSFSMPVEGEILKNHSETMLQYSKTFSDMRLHTGIDIACKDGTFVSACSTGTVTEITKDSSLGNCILIDHGNSIVVKYASIENPKVKKGDKVNIGDIIGTAGTVPSECGDQSHIHIEVTKNGKPADPLKTFGME